MSDSSGFTRLEQHNNGFAPLTVKGSTDSPAPSTQRQLHSGLGAEPLPSFNDLQKTSTPEVLRPGSTSSSVAELDRILTRAVAGKASDIHFSSDDRIRNRVDGDLVVMGEFPRAMTRDWLEDALKSVLSDELWSRYLDHHEADTSYQIENVARFRVNVFRQRGVPGAVFRVIPTVIKSIEELGVPEQLKTIAQKPKGLILVTGPTGSGKSTTLTAMLDEINETRPDHIMTIEDPIEFVHTSKKSLVNQREVGEDTNSFAEALKRVLRQDPDVILVGELRDPETIATALTAAETGHLVFGTLHTQSASKTIDRIVDSFDATQQGQIKAQLADTLQAVVAQTLMKKIGGGRIAATEILIRTSGIANNIREGNISQIYSAIQTGKEHGMHSLDQDLLRLTQEGLIERADARRLMVDPSAIDDLPIENLQSDSYWE